MQGWQIPLRKWSSVPLPRKLSSWQKRRFLESPATRTNHRVLKSPPLMHYRAEVRPPPCAAQNMKNAGIERRVPARSMHPATRILSATLRRPRVPPGTGYDCSHIFQIVSLVSTPRNSKRINTRFIPGVPAVCPNPTIRLCSPGNAFFYLTCRCIHRSILRTVSF